MESDSGLFAAGHVRVPSVLSSSVLSAMGPILTVGAVAISVVVVGVFVLGVIVAMGVMVLTVMQGHMQAMERLVVGSMTATSTAMEEAVVRAVQGTAEAVGVGVSEGVSRTLDKVWGPAVQMDGQDEGDSADGVGSGDPDSEEDIVAPWMKHLEEAGFPLDMLGIDPTDASIPEGPPMDSADRAIVVPPGFDPLAGVGAPDMTGEMFGEDFGDE